MRSWNIHFKWGLYLLIGINWKRDGNCIDVYIYPIPFFVIHFSFWGRKWGMPSLDPDDNDTKG